MEMVRHEDKFVQEKFFLCPEFVKDLDEQLRHAMALQQAPSIKCGRGDEECCGTSVGEPGWNGHGGLKPAMVNKK